MSRMPLNAELSVGRPALSDQPTRSVAGSAPAYGVTPSFTVPCPVTVSGLS